MLSTRNMSKSKVQNRYIFEAGRSTDDRQFPNDMHIKPVTRYKEFKTFYQVPFTLYENNPFWVAPFFYEMKDFFKKKNLFWSHAEGRLFIARKNHKVVGRIAAIIDDAYCRMVGKKIGFFGFFECIEDYECAAALLQTAQDWLAERKINILQGPINGRVDVGCGFLLIGYDTRPSLLSTYSPAYYITFAERFGLKKSRDLLVYSIDLTKPIPEKLEEKAHQCAASGIHLRPFNRLRTQTELKWWVPLFLETFTDHWGYVPVTEEEVKTRFGVKQLRWFVDPWLFVVAEENETPIAYLWATPDYNQVIQKMKGRLGPRELIQFFYKKRRIHSGKLNLIGIKNEFRHKNVGSFLNYHVLVEMKKRGYTTAEVGWIDEQNTIAHATMAITGATVVKKHRVFEKDIKV